MMGTWSSAYRALKELNLVRVVACWGGDSLLGLGEGQGWVSLRARRRVVLPLPLLWRAASGRHTGNSPLCWTTMHNCPPGALEKVLKVTAGESHRTWLSCGLLSQGTPLSCQHRPSPVSMGSPLLLQPPGCSLLQQGHSPSSPWRVAIAQLGACPEQWEVARVRTGWKWFQIMPWREFVFLKACSLLPSTPTSLLKWFGFP